jgi:hypothetical protein
MVSILDALSTLIRHLIAKPNDYRPIGLKSFDAPLPTDYTAYAAPQLPKQKPVYQAKAKKKVVLQAVPAFAYSTAVSFNYTEQSKPRKYPQFSGYGRIRTSR